MEMKDTYTILKKERKKERKEDGLKVTKQKLKHDLYKKKKERKDRVQCGKEKMKRKKERKMLDMKTPLHMARPHNKHCTIDCQFFF